MTDVSKRGLLKGAMGGAALLASQRQTAEGRGFPTPSGSYGGDAAYRKCDPKNQLPAMDPLWEAKNLFRQHAEQMANKERQRLEYKIEALDDIKSISTAYYRYMVKTYREEIGNVNERLFAIMRSI